MKLPSWPPCRIVSEAILSHNLRHPDGPRLDLESSPWPELHAAVLRFLRHQLTDYDEELRHRCRDKVYRDQLAAAVTQAAHRQYTWLRIDRDPRPFQQEESHDLLFDQLAKTLAQLHTARDHIESAIRTLKRTAPDHKAELQRLQKELTLIKEEISYRYSLLTNEVPSPDFSRAVFFRHSPSLVGSYLFAGHKLAESHTRYAGFRCQFCHLAVMRSKRALPLGQGRLAVVYSCGCQSYALEPPAPHYRSEPVTADFWQKLGTERN